MGQTGHAGEQEGYSKLRTSVSVFSIMLLNKLSIRLRYILHVMAKESILEFSARTKCLSTRDYQIMQPVIFHCLLREPGYSEPNYMLSSHLVSDIILSPFPLSRSLFLFTIIVIS